MTVETMKRLRELAAERKAQQKIRDDAQKKYDDAGDEIGALMTANDLSVAELGDYGIKLIPMQGRESIQSHLLLQLGVPLETIKAATKRGEPGLQVRVSAVGEPAS